MAVYTSRTRFSPGQRFLATDVNRALDELEGITTPDGTATYVGPALYQGDATFEGLLRGPGKLKIGATGWMEAITGTTENYAQATILSTIGGPGLTVATRSSDGGGGAGGQFAWALGTFVENDFAKNAAGQDQRQTGYCIYGEARRGPGAGSVEGIEISVGNNGGDEVVVSPYGIGQTGETFGMLLGAGLQNQGETRKRASAGLVIQGGPDARDKWFTGILFGVEALAPNPAFGRPIAVDMAKEAWFVWRNATNEAPLSWIGSAALVPGEGGILEFGRSTVTLRGNTVGADGANNPGAGAGLVIDRTTNDFNTYGTLRVHDGAAFSGGIDVAGPAQFGAGLGWSAGYKVAASDADAAAQGVGISKFYVNSTTGAVTLRRV